LPPFFVGESPLSTEFVPDVEGMEEVYTRTVKEDFGFRDADGIGVIKLVNLAGKLSDGDRLRHLVFTCVGLLAVFLTSIDQKPNRSDNTHYNDDG
jgi:hypothetical protein